MPLLTTTIGAYPKPDYAPIGGWYAEKDAADRGRHPSDPTRAYSAFLARRSAADEEALDRATREVVAEQAAAGIDVPTDGEVRRDHYVYYHCRHLEGFDFAELTDKPMRGGSWTARVPTVRGPVRPGPRFLRRDWQVAQAATRRPVKITVPGPLTVIDSTADAHYGDERRLAADLGDALNAEIRDLAAAGCPWIQVDEPVFARQPERALAFGMDALARCFHRVPAGVRRAVHVCCGYPAELDMEDYPKADPQAYFELAAGLAEAPVDAISLEDAHRPNDLGLLERFAEQAVILGCVDIARTRVEPMEEIRQRLAHALGHIDAERLIAGPDCGLVMLPRGIARAKLESLAAAAHSLG